MNNKWINKYCGTRKIPKDLKEEKSKLYHSQKLRKNYHRNHLKFNIICPEHQYTRPYSVPYELKDQDYMQLFENCTWLLKVASKFRLFACTGLRKVASKFLLFCTKLSTFCMQLSSICIPQPWKLREWNFNITWNFHNVKIFHMRISKVACKKSKVPCNFQKLRAKSRKLHAIFKKFRHDENLL